MSTQAATATQNQSQKYRAANLHETSSLLDDMMGTLLQPREELEVVQKIQDDVTEAQRMCEQKDNQVKEIVKGDFKKCWIAIGLGCVCVCVCVVTASHIQLIFLSSLPCV